MALYNSSADFTAWKESIAEGSRLSYIVGSAVVLFSAVQYLQARKRDIDLPAVGPSGRISSYYGAVRFIKNAREMINEGVQKYNGRPFKVPEFSKWTVLVSSPELIDEVRRAPDSKLSFMAATNDSLAIPWTMGRQIADNAYHVPVVRSQLTRNLDVLFDDVRDEVTQAFSDLVPATADDWVAVPAFRTIMKIVARTSNRIFVGLPLCRNEDYCNLNMTFTMDVVKASKIIKMFPTFLKPFVGELLTSVPKNILRGMRHLGPSIEYRLRQRKEHGKDWPEKPNDVLSWLIDEAPPEELDVKNLTRRVLTLNFAAIHTSTMSFTHALFHLAARPQYIQPLREEVEAIIKDEGWTKASLAKMRKLDSFLRESQRYNGLGLVTMGRKALVDYTLSDGTFLPKGTVVSVSSVTAHFDEKYYANAHEFDGFRFADLHDEGDSEGAKYQFVSTSLEYLTFGHGRHACPGRFFAANELKAMLAYVVYTYDIKLENEGVRPKDLNFGITAVPNPKANVLFKKRSS